MLVLYYGSSSFAWTIRWQTFFDVFKCALTILLIYLELFFESTALATISFIY